jgi:ABC-2 type transport system ATP-binding protein
VRRALLIAAFIALLAPAPADAFTKNDLTIRMSDGVDIAATYYTPDGPPPLTGRPAVMLLHGLGENRSRENNGVGISINSIAERYLVPHGYVALTFDARGHGGSGGRVGVNGPREVSDVRELFTWLAGQGGVNPSRIGAYGYSYGGGALWGAAAQGVPFAALEIAITWTDLYAALVPQDLAKSGVILGFYQSVAQRIAPEVDEVLQLALRGRNLARVRAFTRERSSRPALGRISTPTFLLQGRRDFAFDLEHAFAARRLLRGPKRLYLAGFGHAPSPKPAGELDYVLPQARMWFDRFLKGLPNGIDTRPSVELAPDPWTGRTFSYRGLPATRALRLVYPGQRSIGKRGKVSRTRRLPRARQETFGAPTARVRLSSTSGWNEVVAVLSALTPRGPEIVLSAGGARVRLGRRPKTVAIRMLSQVTAIPARSRLRLTVGATSTVQNPGNLLYLTSNVPSSARLTVGRATVTLPVLTRPVSR